MRLEILRGSVFLGTTVRGVGGVYAYGPDGAPIGTFNDSDAAAAALARLAPVAA